MDPRKKESKKWSPLPPELSNQIKSVFVENFESRLDGKLVKVEGRIYPTEILMRVGINTKGELRFQNFEVSLDHSPLKKDTLAQINIAVDAIASLMLEYFDNDEDHEMPYVWQEYPFEKQSIWLQYSSVNSDLEAEANKLLGLTEDDSLLKETEEDMEALGLNDDASEIPDDEEIDTSKPKIFRVPTDNEHDTLKKKKKKEDMH
jgi:hypothetical protein